MPGPLACRVWWCGLNFWGRKRAHYFGTFGLSTYGALCAASLHPLSPLTTTFNYGMISPNGDVEVRPVTITASWTVQTVARALQDLERVLQCEIVAELRYLRAVEAA